MSDNNVEIPTYDSFMKKLDQFQEDHKDKISSGYVIIVDPIKDTIRLETTEEKVERQTQELAREEKFKTQEKIISSLKELNLDFWIKKEGGDELVIVFNLNK